MRVALLPSTIGLGLMPMAVLVSTCVTAASAGPLVCKNNRLPPPNASSAGFVTEPFCGSLH